MFRRTFLSLTAVSMLAVGPAFADPMCLRFAQWLEREYRGFEPPPALVD